MNLSEISVGGGKGRIPWARLKEAPGNFILSKYLPASVTLTQYHHICQEDVNALLKHWMQRQAAGKIPFCFKMRDVCRVQAQENDKETPGDGNALTKEGADRNSQEDSAGGPSGVSKLLVLMADAYHLFPHLQCYALAGTLRVTYAKSNTTKSTYDLVDRVRGVRSVDIAQHSKAPK